MTPNSLNLTTTPLHKLRLGQAALLGPYKSPCAAASKISHCRKRHQAMADWKFSQQQLLLVDPGEDKVYKMYLITRVE